jgi:toxin ParE1/3/4
VPQVDFDLRLRPEASLDLDAIWDYSVSQWSLNQAEDYVRSFQTVFARLCSVPFLGREMHGIRPQTSMIRHQSHMIFYCVSEHALENVRIVHARANWTALFGD